MRRDRVMGQVCGWRKLDLQPLDGENWLLVQNLDDPLRFVHATRDLILTPPRRYETDLGSIPAWARLYMGGPAGDPEVAQHAGKVYPLHDWAYECQRWDDGTPITRREADELLYAALECVHCSEEYATEVYLAVRLGGGSRWREHIGQTPPQYGGRV